MPRILVIDDDLNMRKVLALALRAAGYHTVQLGKAHLYRDSMDPGVHVDQFASRLEQLGFAEVLETGDKFDLVQPNRYTDHLRERGLLDAYSQYITYAQSPFAGRPGFVNDVTFGNPGLRNERAREYELGADVGFLNGRLGVEATYYDRLVSDLLFFRPLSTATGSSRTARRAAPSSHPARASSPSPTSSRRR